MTGTIRKSNHPALALKLNGRDAPMEYVGIDQTGMAEVPTPGAGVTPVHGIGEYGNPIVLTTNDDAPSGLPTTTITFYEEGSIHYLQAQRAQRGVFPVQRVFNPPGTSRSNPGIWDAVHHIGRCRVTGGSLGAGPALPYAGDAMQSTAEVTGEYVVQHTWGSLSAQTTGEAENIIAIAVLDELSTVPGYPGPGQIMYAVAAPGSGVTPNVYVSTNGGGTWTVLATDPLAADESATDIAIRFVNSTQFRVIIQRGTADASNEPEIVYSNFTLGAETTISAWTSVEQIGADNDAGEAMAWVFPERLYIAAAGDIYLSTDFGASNSSIYTGSTVINGFAKAPNNDVYAFGASNLLLKERAKSGSFNSVVGPTGSNASTAFAAIGREGTAYWVGNGTSIFRTYNPTPTVAGDWTSMRNFGSNQSVVAIYSPRSLEVPHGDPDLVYVVVDDTAGSNGTLWFTRDGGYTWRQVTTLTNTGYNGAYFSSVDPNLGWIVGDDGAVHQYAP